MLGEDKLEDVVKAVKIIKEALGCGSQKAYNYYKRCHDPTESYLLKHNIIPFNTEIISERASKEPKDAEHIVEGSEMIEQSYDDRLNDVEEADWDLFLHEVSLDTGSCARYAAYAPAVRRARDMDRRKD